MVTTNQELITDLAKITSSESKNTTKENHLTTNKDCNTGRKTGTTIKVKTSFRMAVIRPYL